MMHNIRFGSYYRVYHLSIRPYDAAICLHINSAYLGLVKDIIKHLKNNFEIVTQEDSTSLIFPIPQAEIIGPNKCAGCNGKNKKYCYVCNGSGLDSSFDWSSVAQVVTNLQLLFEGLNPAKMNSYDKNYRHFYPQMFSVECFPSDGTLDRDLSGFISSDMAKTIWQRREVVPLFVFESMQAVNEKMCPSPMSKKILEDTNVIIQQDGRILFENGITRASLYPEQNSSYEGYEFFSSNLTDPGKVLVYLAGLIGLT